MLQQPVALDDLKHGQGRSAGNWVAAERRAVVTLGEASAALPQADARSDRESAAEPFGQGQYIGLHAFGLVGEPCPGPADAALDLIDYQQRAGEVAGFPGGAQITLRGRHDSAL